MTCDKLDEPWSRTLDAQHPVRWSPADGDTPAYLTVKVSGVVRDAFRSRGIDAVSFDLLPSERSEGPHVMGDVRETFEPAGFDLVICHPPCTYLAVSGARWMAQRQDQVIEALAFVRWCMDLPVPRVVVENPVSIISSRIRRPDQIIQPWQFGHGETKATCLWLRGVPPLRPTMIVDGRQARVHRMAPSPERWRERSRTYAGIAEAMADQWGET